MKTNVVCASIVALFFAGNALYSDDGAASGGTLDTAEELIDELALTADTNITVAAGNTLRIEYMHAAEPCVVTKSGGGRLVLAVLGMGANITVHVEEGTLVSSRPARLPQIGEYPVGMHVDAAYFPSVTTLGYSVPHKGGIVLAEALIFSNRLEQAEGDRIEAYLKSKWFGSSLDVSPHFSPPAISEATRVALDISDLVRLDSTNTVTLRAGGLSGSFYRSNGVTDRTPGVVFGRISIYTEKELSRIPRATEKRMALKRGALYYHYCGGTPYPTLSSKMFPFTPIELHGGWLVGKERILTAVSGEFGWRGESPDVDVFVFDEFGREVKGYPFAVRETPQGRIFTLELKSDHCAAIVRK